MKKRLFQTKTFAGTLSDQLLAFNGLNMTVVSDSYQSTFLRSQGELVYSDVVIPLFNYPSNIDQQRMVQDMTQILPGPGFDGAQPALATFSYVLGQKQTIEVVPMPGVFLYAKGSNASTKLSFAFNDYLNPVAESERLQKPFNQKMTRMLYTMQILLQLNENLVSDILRQARKWEKELRQKVEEQRTEATKAELIEIEKRLFYLTTLQDLIKYAMQLKKPTAAQTQAGQLFQGYFNQMPIDDAMNQFLGNHYEQIYAQKKELTILKLGILN
jgi:hypothetical protein